MRAPRVVRAPPAGDEDLGFGAGREDLGGAARVAARAVGCFHGAGLPGTAGCDAAWRAAQPAEPGPHRGRRELGAVVRARTASDRRQRATAMRVQARVGSSTRACTRRGRPSCVRSLTKAEDQTWCGRAARRRGLRGTRRPSWRQRRGTRLWVTRPAAARRRAVMRRDPERPNRRARGMRRAIQAGSSAATRAGLRGVLRGWASPRQAQRAETGTTVRPCMPACRRRAGRSSCPRTLPASWRWPGPGRRPAACAWRSPAPAPCAASPDPRAGRRPPAASGRRSAPSRRAAAPPAPRGRPGPGPPPLAAACR